MIRLTNNISHITRTAYQAIIFKQKKTAQIYDNLHSIDINVFIQEIAYSVVQHDL
jgi:hypothetical protein